VFLIRETFDLMNICKVANQPTDELNRGLFFGYIFHYINKFRTMNLFSRKVDLMIPCFMFSLSSSSSTVMLLTLLFDIIKFVFQQQNTIPLMAQRSELDSIWS
jgi:hypothetical protein